MTSREVSGTSQAVTEASGTITVEETVPNRLRYNGQMADGLTGLYYLRARYYNASLGRFTQEDVIYNDGLNLYAYCGSNPVMYEDPSGYVKVCKKDGEAANSDRISFDEALQQLEKSGLKPGQTVISKSRVMSIVENYDPIKANSSVYTDATGRYLVEGHHTTVATVILGKSSGINMNTPTKQVHSEKNIHWTKKAYEFWKKSIKILE